jgi:predicted GNAT family acetyltransferase
MTDANADDEIGHIVIDGHAWPIVIDRASGRFEVRVGDHVAFMTFHQHGSVLSLIHTESPPELRGHGVAQSLVEAVLVYARDRAMTIKPYCPFVTGYLRRHAGYQQLVDPGFAAVDATRSGE